MAGHSQFKNIMHRKGRQDAMKSKLFGKLAREITVAAKLGTPDPAMNPRLRAAVVAARAENMPKDNIERAIKKALGGEGENYAEIRYEGYGPGGVAVIVEALTDNRNRAATDVRTAMNKNGGNMADAGSVSYLFNRKGVAVLEKGDHTEDDILLAVLDAGAEEVNDIGEKFEVVCESSDMNAVRDALKEAEIDYDSVEQDFRATMEVPADASTAKKVFNLIDALEDSDDVQNVFTNMNLSDEVLAELDGE